MRKYFLSLPVSLRAVLNARRGNPITRNLPMVLARDLPQTLCHCELLLSLRAVLNARRGNPITRDLPAVLAHDLPASPLSLRRNVVTDAICLQATLVFGLLRYARNDKKQDGARLKASRHDNLLLDRHTTFAMTIRTAFAMAILNLSTVLASEPCHCEET